MAKSVMVVTVLLVNLVQLLAVLEAKFAPAVFVSTLSALPQLHALLIKFVMLEDAEIELALKLLVLTQVILVRVDSVTENTIISAVLTNLKLSEITVL